MPWEVEFDPVCESWAESLDQADQEALLAAIRVLKREGPALGRPLVDTVKASRHKSMKELRPPSAGTSEMRVLFAFDPSRTAILLVGGDKSGAWKAWYREHLQIADDRYDDHLARLVGETEPQQSAKKHKRGKR